MYKSIFFEVVDYYDNQKGDVVYTCETIEEAKKLARHYDHEECDGECEVYIRKYENGKHVDTIMFY